MKLICLLYSSGPRGHDRMVVRFTTTYAIQNLEPLNPVHGEVHPIQHYVISVDVTCDRSVVLKRDISEILLKVVFNTITLL